MTEKYFLDEWQFVCDIKKGEKPCFNDKTFIEMNAWFVTWRRRYKGEKGEKGIIYLDNLIENTSAFIKKDEITNEFLKKLKDVLQNSILGINNLSYTYKIDNQEQVAKDYSNLIDKIEKIILYINSLIKPKTNFFASSFQIVNVLNQEYTNKT